MHNFDDQLKNEDIDWFKPFFKIVSGTDNYEKTGLAEDYGGIDAYAGGVSFQCKIRHSYYNYDVCLEMAHQDIQTQKWWKGWIHEPPKADKLLYGWNACYKGKDSICLVMSPTALYDAYFKNKASWDKRKKKNRYPSKDSKGRQWWTWNVYIPVHELRADVEIGHYSMPAINR